MFILVEFQANCLALYCIMIGTELWDSVDEENKKAESELIRLL